MPTFQPRLYLNREIINIPEKPVNYSDKKMAIEVLQEAIKKYSEALGGEVISISDTGHYKTIYRNIPNRLYI